MAPLSTSQALLCRIRDELIDQWMCDTPKRIFIVPLCAVLVAVALHDAAPTDLLVGWIAAIALVSLWRFFLYRRYLRTSVDAAARVASARDQGLLAMVVVCVTCLGLAWGMSMLLGFHFGSEDPAILATVGVITAAMAVVTIGGMFPLAGFMMTLGIFAPFEVWSFWRGDRQVTMLALGGLVYISILVVWSRGLYRNVVDTMLLRHEKDELVRELSRAKDNAERANIEKSRFLAAASHDLRQPMQSLWLFVGNLRRQWGQPQTLQTLDYIENALDAMRSLFDALLGIAQLDAGGVQAEMRAVPIQQTLDKLRDGFSGDCDLKGLRFSVWPSKAWVYTDPALLDRIVFNLMSNAVKYTPSGGGVVVGCRQRGHELEIQVWDSGIGIAVEHQASVFDEFVQLDNPQRDRSKGLGLGLSIARRLADLVGARLSLRSRIHKGSVFSLRVPLTQADVCPGLDSNKESAPALAGLTVVFLEDEVAILQAVQQYCQALGMQFYGAGDLETLQVLLQGVVPDIVLSDYSLASGENGLQAISRMREQWPLVGAALLTGNAQPSLRDQAQSMGVMLLYKPLSPVELASALGSFAKFPGGGRARGEREN